ncbi:MAG: tetratricopeptide repeat protein [Flavobacteriales bacterium]
MPINLKIFAFSLLFIPQLEAQTWNPMQDTEDEIRKADDLAKDQIYSLSSSTLQSAAADGVDAKAHPKTISRKAQHLLNSFAQKEQSAQAEAIDFLSQHPFEPEAHKIRFALANALFDQGRFNEALAYFQSCDLDFLTKNEQSQFLLYQAYSLFKNGQTQESLALLDQLKTSNEPYLSQSRYYKALIYFEQQDWKKALQHFDACKQTTDPNLWVTRYAETLFNLQYHKEAIKFCRESRLLKIDEAERLDLVEGMAYNQKNQHKDAVRLLKNQSNLPSDAQYALGFSQIKIGDTKLGKASLLAVSQNPNPVIYQNAQFLLAKISLDEDNKLEAIQSMQRVVDLAYDKKITENAHFQLIKLSFEHNDVFSDTEKIIQNFLKTYPKSIYVEEVNGILAQQYVKKEQYQLAVETIERSPIKHIRIKKLYQEICLFQGIRFYNQQAFPAARQYFDKSLKNPIKAELKAQALFWKAESFSREQKPNQAIAAYRLAKKSTSPSDWEGLRDLDYHLAYAYFGQERYAESISQFKNYLRQSKLPKSKKVDVYLRLGDAFMLTRNYQEAKTYFRKAASSSGSKGDYAAYSEAICANLLDDFNEEVSLLNNFDLTYPKSVYRAKAKFQLAESYYQQRNYNQAQHHFIHFLSSYPKNELSKTTRMRLASINYHQGRLDEALTDLKILVAEFPNTELSTEALNLIKNVYSDQGNPQAYRTYTSQLDFFNATEDLDSYSFYPVRDQYLAGSYNKALSGFEDYLANFPKGKHRQDAQFFLSDCYIKNGQNAKAKSLLESHLNGVEGEFTETALSRLASLHFKNKDYQKALETYERLKTTSQHESYLEEAEINIVRSHFALENYNKVMQIANAYLENKETQDENYKEMDMLLAKAAFHRHSYSIAKEHFYGQIQHSTEYKYESIYYMMQMALEEDDFETISDHVSSLNDKTALNPYAYDCYFIYGQAVEKRNIPETAKVIYQKIIDDADDPTLVQKAQEAYDNLN